MLLIKNDRNNYPKIAERLVVNWLNGSIFAFATHMKKLLFLGLISVSAAAILVSCAAGNKINYSKNSLSLPEINRVIYLDPEIDPDIDEIKDPTYLAFFSAVTDNIRLNNGHRMVRINNTMKYDSIDANTLKEFCVNNDSQLVIVPKVKYFKVGFGKYVFSNQVLVSMKLFDADGNYIMETSYDTYRGKGRLLGNTENSVKIGTKNAMELMTKGLKQKNPALYRELKKAS